MDRIRVLQLLPVFRPGGAEQVVLDLVRRLPAEGFEPIVAALDGRGAMAERFAEARVRAIDLGQRRRISVGAPRRLSALVRDEEFPLVHSHLFRAHLALWSATRRMREPPHRIATEHQADPRLWATRVTRLVTRRFDAVTAVGEGVGEHLRKRGFPAGRVTVIPNGVAVEPIASAGPVDRASLGLAPSDRVVLFVGRLHRQKGVSVLLEAVSRLAERWPQLRLLVVGEGPDREALERLGRWLGVADRVRFLGRREDVPSLMKSADVVALPSRWEGLSLVLLEGMAAGRPVVATRVAGQREVIADGESGLLVGPDDPVELARALGRVLADDGLATHLGAAARRRVADGLTAETMAWRYAELYRRVLVDRATRKP